MSNSFDGPADVYGSNGFYKWTGNTGCSGVGADRVCTYVLHPGGPAPMIGGFAPGQKIPSYSKCRPGKLGSAVANTTLSQGFSGGAGFAGSEGLAAGFDF
eukprot:Sspe_Gene.76854::Locus_48004_Transcript_1_1_Confidence_1.000_Length_409::g.76854::m.76854